MKNPHFVLREKEQDVDRVRREVQALLVVIPLLTDDEPSSDVMHQLPLNSSRNMSDPPEDDLAELERYYPFISHLRMSERKGRVPREELSQLL